MVPLFLHVQAGLSKNVPVTPNSKLASRLESRHHVKFASHDACINTFREWTLREGRSTPHSLVSLPLSPCFLLLSGVFVRSQPGLFGESLIMVATSHFKQPNNWEVYRQRTKAFAAGKVVGAVSGIGSTPNAAKPLVKWLLAWLATSDVKSMVEAS